MKAEETQYGKAALAALELCARNKIDPITAWEEAVASVTSSKDSREKSCPMSAFLGLCEEGMIHGVARGCYLNRSERVRNKAYAVEAVRFLAEDQSLGDDRTKLWHKVMQSVGQKNKRQNGQMAVVLALWNNGKIRSSATV